MWRNSYEIKREVENDYELEERWRSGYEWKEIIYFEK